MPTNGHAVRNSRLSPHTSQNEMDRPVAGFLSPPGLGRFDGVIADDMEDCMRQVVLRARTGEAGLSSTVQ